MKSIALAPLTLLFALACGTPGKSAEGPGTAGPRADLLPLPPSALPWTDAFLESALLVAETVYIVGPPGLISHFVGRVEEGILTEVKAVPEGLRQTYSVARASAGLEIRAQLDQLSIVAERRLVVLERPGPVDVVVEASGDVYHRDAAGLERRVQVLRLAGPLNR
jgi:hypothetical protein